MDGNISSQNLIKQVNIESTVRRPNFYKPLIFDALVILSAFGAGYDYLRYLFNQTSAYSLILTWLIFGILATLHIFFTKSLSRLFLLLLLEAVSIISLFYFSGFGVITLAAAAAAFMVFAFWGGILGHMELQNNLDIRFFKTAWLILKKLTTAIVATIIIIYLPRLDSKSNLFLSKETFQALFNKTAVFVGNFYPQVDFTSSLDKLSQDIARLELQNNPAFNNMPSADKDAIVKQTSGQVADNLSKQLGVAVSPNESVGDIFYDFVVNFLGNLKDHFQNWFLVGWALIVFLIVRSVGIVFYWIAGFADFLLYQIFLASGFIHILGESRTHEIIEF